MRAMFLAQGMGAPLPFRHGGDNYSRKYSKCDINMSNINAMGGIGQGLV